MNEQQPRKEQEEQRGGDETAAEAQEAEPRAGPRIYVASLSDYNDGILHGTWLDAAVEHDDLQTGIHQMLAASPTARRYGEPAEEWAIHDVEGFGGLSVGEYESVERITAMAKGIAEHGLAFAAWVADVGGDAADTQRFEEAFLGSWDSAEDYARQLVDDLGTPNGLHGFDEWLLSHIDYSSIARDLTLGGDNTVVEKPGGGVWVFEGN